MLQPASECRCSPERAEDALSGLSFVSRITRFGGGRSALQQDEMLSGARRRWTSTRTTESYQPYLSARYFLRDPQKCPKSGTTGESFYGSRFLRADLYLTAEHTPMAPHFTTPGHNTHQYTGCLQLCHSMLTQSSQPSLTPPPRCDLLVSPKVAATPQLSHPLITTTRRVYSPRAARLDLSPLFPGRRSCLTTTRTARHSSRNLQVSRAMARRRQWRSLLHTHRATASHLPPLPFILLWYKLLPYCVPGRLSHRPLLS